MSKHFTGLSLGPTQFDVLDEFPYLGTPHAKAS